MTLHGLGHARYELSTFGQPQGSQTVLSLGHSDCHTENYYR